MSNYIKTLLLSTMVLVIGNNSNYCYSNNMFNNFNNMVINIQQEIAQNNHVIMNYDLSKGCNDALLELYHMQTRNAYIIKELIKGYSAIVAFIDDVIVNDGFDYFDENTKEKEFAKQLVNRLSMPVVNMLINIKNQTQNNQLLNQQQLQESILHCTEEIINVANNVLLDLKSPNNQIDIDSTKYAIDYINRGIKRLHKLQGWILLIRNDHNTMTNYNFSGECNEALSELFKCFDENSPNAHIIYNFAMIYNSITTRISDNGLVEGLVEDYANKFEEENENDLDNARTFTNQLSNSITKHVINMLINIENGRLNNDLNQQQLEELISHCINNIINTSNDVIIELTTDNNPLSNIYNKYFPNNNYVELAVHFITTGIEKLRELKQQYNLP